MLLAFAARLFDIASLTDRQGNEEVRGEGKGCARLTGARAGPGRGFRSYYPAKKPTEFPNGKGVPDVSARHFRDMWPDR